MADTARKLTYKIGFTADTSQLQTALERAAKSLQSISSQGTGNSISKELRLASQAAAELEAHLASAYNRDTGKFDLSIFRQNLAASGKTLQDYSMALTQVGSEGEKAFAHVAQAISSVQGPLYRSSALFDKLWITMKNTMRWQITTTALRTFTGGIQTAYRYAQDLNESLNSIRIVTGQSTEEMAKFAQQANEAARALSTTTTEYTNAALIYARQGLSADEIEGRTNVTVKLANVAGEAAEKASEQLTSVWNNFYDGSKSLEYYADVMTALGSKTASSTEEISQGLQKFAAVADTVGLSYEYAASALATVTATTRQSADTVGTAFRTLFGRLESLKLGETLEDGTTLNKYSQALKTVGVDINDVNGNLKDMDQILSETMAKWDTLNRNQQMALAQTVAGVRQYATFIALMDNADYFERNLEVAKESEGTLQRQADIYAESWEAARDRVKAAAEDVYSSLFNDKTFIDIDNTLATILDRVDNMIDAFGGLGGTLNVVFHLMGQIYGSKMAAGIDNSVQNILTLTGVTDLLNKSLRDTAVEQMKAFVGTGSDLAVAGEAANAVREAYVDTALAMNEYAEKQASMSVTERMVAEARLEQMTQLREKIVEIQGDIEELAATANQTEQKIAQAMVGITNPSSFVKNNSSFTKEMKQTFMELTGDITAFEQKANKLYVGAGFDKNFLANITKLRQAYQDAGVEVANLNERISELSKTPNLTKEQNREIAELAAQVDNLEHTMDVVINIFKQFFGTGQEAAEASEQIEADFKHLADISGELAGKERDLTDTTNTLKGALDQSHNALANLAEQPLTVGQRFMNLSMAVSSAAMAFNAFKSIGRVFSDEDMTTGDRITTLLMSFSMILGAANTALNLLNHTKAVSVVVDKLTKTNITQETAAQGANTLAAIANARAKKMLAENEAFMSAATSDATKKIIAETAMLQSWLITLAPIILTAAAIGVAIYGLAKAYNADADAAKEAAKKHEDAAKAASEAKDKYQDLLSTIKDYNDAINVTKDLTKSTEELAESVEKANEKARELLDTYEELRGAVSFQDGVMVIDEQALKSLEAKQKQEKINAALEADRTGLEAAYAARKSATTDAYRAFKGNIPGYYTNYGLGQKEFEKALAYVQNGGSKEGLLQWVVGRNYNNEMGEADRLNTGLASAYDGLVAFAAELNEFNAVIKGYNLTIANDLLSGNDKFASLSGSAKDAATALMGNWIERYNSIASEVNLDKYATQYDASGFSEAYTVYNEDAITADYKKYVGDPVGKTVEEMYAELKKLTQLSASTGQEMQDKLISAISNVEEYATSLGGEGFAKVVLDAFDLDAQLDSAAFSPQQIREFENNLDTLLESGQFQQAWEAAGYESANAYTEAIREQLKNYDPSAWEAAIYDKYVQIANAGRKALSFIADTKKGGLLDEETIQSLQQQFAGLFDFSNLDTLSLKDQALEVTEALRAIDDPERMIETNKERIKGIEEYEQKVKEASDDLFRAEKEDDQALAKQRQEDLKNYKKQLKDLSMNLDSGEAKRQLSAQIEELEQIEPIKLKVEIDRASANAMLGVMQRMSKLVEKDFTVTADNVAEVARLMPEVFEQAEVDATTGLVKLKEEVVQHMFDLALTSAGINRQAAIDTLQSRIETTTAELGVMRGMYDQINTQSSQSADSQIADMNLTRGQIDATSKKILAGRIKDFLQEQTASEDTASKTVQDMNHTAEASSEQSSQMARNYGEAATQIYTSLFRAFRHAWENGEELKNLRKVVQKEAVSAFNAAGFSHSSSKDTWDYTKTTSSKYGYLQKFLDSGLNLDDIENELDDNAAFHDFERHLKQELEEAGFGTWSDNDLYNLSDSMISALGGSTDTGAAKRRLNQATDGTFQGEGEDALKRFLGYLEKGISYGDYTLGQDIMDLATYAGLDTANLFKHKSDGSSKEPVKKLTEEKVDKDQERYHVINRLIKEQERELSNLETAKNRAFGSKRLEEYDKTIEAINKQMENHNAKLKEAQEQWLPKDINDVRAKFGNAVYNDAEKRITNIHELVQQTIDGMNAAAKVYNDWVDRYNDLTAEEQNTVAEKEEKERQDHAYKEAKRLYDERMKMLNQYEETVDLIAELEDNIAEDLRKRADEALEKINYRLEVVIQIKDLKKQINEFSKAISESFGDALTHTLSRGRIEGVAGINKTNAELELGMYDEYLQTFNELKASLNDPNTDTSKVADQIEDLTGKVIDSGEALLDWIDYWENMVPEAVSAAHERFNKFVEALDHNSSVSQMIQELYALQGQTYKTAAGFARLQKTSQEVYDAKLASARLNRKWYEDSYAKFLRADAELKNFTGGEDSVQYDYLVKTREAFEKEYKEAQKAMLQDAQAALEEAHTMFSREVDRAIYEFDQKISNGRGTEFMQGQMDHYIELDKQYLDPVNESLETAVWYNKLQADIDKTTNQNYRKRLQALQEEIDLRRENNTLSQYDLDVLNAQYDILKAQMDLEEAKNNKTELRLVRDSQGNWNYQYTASEQEMEAKQNELLQKSQDYWNLTKDRFTELSKQLDSLALEYQEKMAEIEQQFNDGLIDQETRQKMIDENQSYYESLMGILAEELDISIADMNKAGIQAELYSAAASEAVAQTASDEIQRALQAAQDAGQSMMDILTSDLSQLSDIINGEKGLQSIHSTYATNYQNDLANMTIKQSEFKSASETLLNILNEKTDTLMNTISTAAEAAGVSIDQLDDLMNILSDSTDELSWRGWDEADSLQEQMQAAYDAADGYREFAESVRAAIEALKDLAREQGRVVEDLGGNNTIQKSTGDHSGNAYSAFKNAGNTINDTVRQELKWHDEDRENHPNKDQIMTGDEILRLLTLIASGNEKAIAIKSEYTFFNKDLLDALRAAGLPFDTGGYTGSWDSSEGKLAFLHEKELVLNQEDTKNILAAVGAVRSIASLLDEGTQGLIGSMIMRLGGLIAPAASSQQLDQTIHIDEISFPNITSADGIEEAFRSLADNASQWIQRRRD